MSATPVRTLRLRRGLALSLSAVLLLACGDAATDPTDDDSDDDQSSSSGSSTSSSSGRASSSGGSSGRSSTSSSSSSGSSSSSSGSSSSSSGGSSSSTSSSSSGSSGEPQLYQVGGSVDGYQGSGLELRLGAQSLIVAAGSTTWIFPQGLPQDATYEVQVATQPSNPTQQCTVANGSGDIDGENVDDVEITCSTIAEHLVRVQTTGLVGSVTLANNGADPLVVNGASATFATALASGAAYDVTVVTQPAGQTCTVSNGSGVIAADDVTVQVTCANNAALEPLGGMVFGLTSPGLVLANGADRVTVDEDSEFFFPNDVAVGTAYDVTVATQPAGQLCTVTDGQGVMVAGGFDDVLVECVATAFPVTVTVSGLEADSVVVNNGADRTISANGSFSYDVQSGGAYEVKVVRNPRSPRQICTVVNGVGVVNAPVDVQITCVSDCAQLVVNEVQVAGAAAGDEFIEILNKGTCAVNFNDYRVVYRSSADGIGLTLMADRTLGAGEYLLFGTNVFSAIRDVGYNGTLGGSAGQVGIVRASNNEVIDGVAWGAVANGTFKEGATITAPAASKSIARVPNGKDTHDNSVDFQVRNPTPRAAN